MKKEKKKVLKVVWIVLGFLLLSVVGLFVYEYMRIKPNDVRFSNVTSSSVTVSWNSKSPTSATTVSFEGDMWMPFTVLGLGGEKFYDSRDVRVAELEAAEKTAMNLYESGDLQPSVEDFEMEIEVTDMGNYYTHHVEIKGLDSETEYSFMIGDRFLYRKVESLGEGSTIMTLEVPDSLKTPVPAYGSVKDAQNKEAVEVDDLKPVTDGVVYFNLLDEFTREKSSVHSSTLNEEGNWYLDISGLRDEDGEPFMNRYIDGETITNVLGEIIIDAGPLGKWEGILNSEVIAPAEMIVINDPLQEQIEGVGIRRVDSNFLGEVVPSVQASGCTFAGYCGPCFDGVLSNSCQCPQSNLDGRPGCKGEESGTMEEAIADVAKGAAGCANGVPNQYVWFDNDCKQCQVYERNEEGGVISYRWKSVGDNDKCAENKDGRVFTPAINPPATSVVESEQDAMLLKCIETGGTVDPGNNLPVCVCPDGSRPQDGDCGEKCASYHISSNSCKCINPADINKLGPPITLYDTLDKCKAALLQGEPPLPSEEEGQDPVCGGRAGSYAATDFAWHPFLSWCLVGSPEKFSPSALFPPMGRTVTWNCKLKDNIKTCSASRDISESLVVKDCQKAVIPGAACRTSEDQNGVCSVVPVNSKCVIPGTTCFGPEENSIYEWSQRGICVIKVSNYVKAVVSKTKLGDQKCDASKCACLSVAGGLLTGYLDEGEYCPSVLVCLPIYNGQVCSTDSSKKICDGFKCVSDVEGIQDKVVDMSYLFSSFVTPTNATEESGTMQYIFDVDTGMIQGLTEGMYVFEYEGENYTFLVDPEKEAEIMIYIDKDNNDQFDEGVDIRVTDLATKIEIMLVSMNYQFELKEGFNFVSFPFVIPGQENKTAAGLLEQLNEVYGDIIFSISKYDGGRWRIVGQNTVLYSNDDFQLLPGEGYLIKARRNINISIVGQPVKYQSVGDSAPVTLYEGWNLVGIYGTGVKTYTAQSMLTDINTSDFTADNVSRWEKEKQMYDGFQMSEGQGYGFDFPINSLESVFVRVLQGRGKWQPKLRTQ